MDQTYIKVRGRWVYLNLAVDKAGQTVECLSVANYKIGLNSVAF
jgi:transposase-like protein